MKKKRDEALAKAQGIISTIKARGSAMTAEERAELTALNQTVEECDAAIKAAAEDDALFAALEGAPGTKAPEPDNDTYRAKSIGDHWAHSVTEKLPGGIKSLGTGQTFAAPELAVKAPGDTHVVGDETGAFGPLITETDSDFVMPHRPRLVVADLFNSGGISGSTIKYPVFGALEGGTGMRGETGTMVQLHVANPSWRSDSLGEVAGFFITSEDMAEDLPYMVGEINATAAYDLDNREEQQLLFGDGTGDNLTGLTVRSGIQTATKGADTVADAVARALGRVQQITGFSADGIVINPEDYEALRLGKDGNGQYYGGGYFSGAYGQPEGILVNPPLWGRRTVVTAAIPAGRVIVGAFNTGKVLRKGGIRVESTNSHSDQFTSARITTRLRKRVGLQVKHPSAFVDLDLTV